MDSLLFIEAQNTSVLKNEKATIIFTIIYFISTHSYLNSWILTWTMDSILSSYPNCFLLSAISWDGLDMFFRDHLHFTFQWLSWNERKRKSWVEGIELKNVYFWTKNKPFVFICIFKHKATTTFACTQICVFMCIFYIHIYRHPNISSI